MIMLEGLRRVFCGAIFVVIIFTYCGIQFIPSEVSPPPYFNVRGTTEQACNCSAPLPCFPSCPTPACTSPPPQSCPSSPCTPTLPSISCPTTSTIFDVPAHITPYTGTIPYSNHELYRKIIQAQSQKPRDLTKPRMIWSINSGRTGSGYLYTLLKAAGANAYHEDTLWMPIQKAVERGWEATFKDRNATKTPQLNAYMHELEQLTMGVPFANFSKPVYADSSHLFYKTIQDIIISQFATKYHITVIVLRKKQIADVVRSQTKVFREISIWPQYIYVPSTCRFALTYPDPPPTTHEEKSMSYLVDVEMHMRRFVHMWGGHPNITIVETTLENLQLYEDVDRFLEQVGLGTAGDIRLQEQVKKVIGFKYNSYYFPTSADDTYLQLFRDFVSTRYPLQDIHLDMFAEVYNLYPQPNNSTNTTNNETPNNAQS